MMTSFPQHPTKPNHVTNPFPTSPPTPSPDFLWDELVRQHLVVALQPVGELRPPRPHAQHVTRDALPWPRPPVVLQNRVLPVALHQRRRLEGLVRPHLVALSRTGRVPPLCHAVHHFGAPGRQGHCGIRVRERRVLDLGFGVKGLKE